MNNKKKKRLILANRLLSGALTLLGFASCSNTIEAPAEYGCPYAEYELKGKVVNAKQEPIEGARMVIRKFYRNYDRDCFSDTIYTREDGTFNYLQRGDIYGKLRLICEDPSGNCRADSTELEVSLKDGKGWFAGAFKQEFDFQLETEDEKEQ